MAVGTAVMAKRQRLLPGVALLALGTLSVYMMSVWSQSVDTSMSTWTMAQGQQYAEDLYVNATDDPSDGSSTTASGNTSVTNTSPTASGKPKGKQKFDIRKRLRRMPNMTEAQLAQITKVNTVLPTVGRCAFRNCPDTSPFVYFVTSHRNRGDSLHRLLASVLDDVFSGVNKHPAQCLCFAAADYDDVVVGAPIAAAMKDWPLDKVCACVCEL